MPTADPSDAPLDEIALVARAKRGDVDAFEALYRANAGRVFALCLQLLGDRTRATEALQDVFVRVWEKLAQFRGESAFGTWVHRVSVNYLLEQRRRDARREARVALDETETSSAFAPRIDADDADTRMDLARALPRLSAGARQVFVLHDVHGYRHEEIARLLGVAESTVRVQLHRARQLLMEALDR